MSLILLSYCLDDPIFPGTLWIGVCTQADCGEYDVGLEITNRKGANFTGTVLYCLFRPLLLFPILTLLSFTGGM